MNVVDSLSVTLSLNDANFSAGMKKAEGAVSGFEKSFASTMAKTGERFVSGAASAAKWGLAISTAAAAASAAIVASGFATAKSLQNTADNLNISVMSFRALADAANDFGIDQAKLTQSLNIFNAQIAGATSGNEALAKSFEDVGLSASELVKLNVDDRLLVVADAVEQAKTQSEKLNIAMTALGSKAGKSFVAFLDQGAAGIKESTDGFKEFHKAINQATFSKINQGQRALDDLGDSIESAKLAFTAGLAPAIKVVADGINNAIARAGGFGAVITEVGKVSQTVAKAIGDAFQGFQVMFHAAGVAISYVSQTLNFMAAVGTSVLNQLKAKWDAWIDVISTGGAFIKDTMDYVWELMKGGFVAAISVMKLSFAGFMDLVARGLDQLPGFEDWAESARKVSYEVAQAADESLQKQAEAQHSAMMEMTFSADDYAAAVTENLATIGSINPFADLTAEQESYFVRMDQNAKNFRKSMQEGLSVVTNVDLGTTGDKLAAFVADMMLKMDELAAKEEENRAAKVEGESVSYAWMGQMATDYYTYLGGLQQANYDSYMANLQQRNLDAQVVLDQETQLAMDTNEARVARELELNTRITEIQGEQARSERQNLIDTEAQWRASWQGKTELMGSFLGQMSQLMQSENTKMFAIGKAAATGEAIINTYKAANAAYASMAGIPIVGPALGAAAAGAAVVAGIANVKRINSTKMGGGAPAGGSGFGNTASGGGGAGGGSIQPDAPTNAAPAPVNRNVNVTLTGERYSRQQVVGLMSEIQSAFDDGHSSFKVA